MEHLRRSYEISIWTLQDSFITVLKPSNLEFKGQIVEPLMDLKDDGESSLSFKIPMYIRNDEGQMIENPLWHNTKDGTIIVDLRKLKVIFNKATTSEEVFEFLITNMEEEHEGLKKYCEVKCEGLAFHELGKQGYKIALEGGDEIDIEQKKYFEGKSKYSTCPQPTINYWADRVFNGSNWRYSVQMDWSTHDGITHQIYNNLDSNNYSSFTEEERNIFNANRAAAGLRRRDRIYEDSFVSAWKTTESGEVIPSSVQAEREKYRLIEADESNRYNLSQTIAETFQVYCKYKYYYDDNYHIIDREVIFYNNFLSEAQGTIDLTYKYNTEHLTRNMDATDTVTKMYVRPLQDGDAPTGQALISDASANKSKEDYLLNFDYLYNIGTITQEQYDEIEPYYTKLHDINEQLIKLGNDIAIKEQEKIKQEARKVTYENMIPIDEENISNNDALARSIGDEEGNIHITADNPQTLFLIKEEGKETYYCNFKAKGIVRNTIELYWDREYNSATKKYELKNPITQYNVVNDEFGEVIKIININKNSHTSSYIHAIFNYSPDTYYKKVSEIYGIKLGQDKAIAEDAAAKVTILEEEIETLTSNRETLLEKKAEIISAFERMMGPALREGQWQPEDEYANYGEVYEEEIQLTNKEDFADGILSLGWDSELFDSEQDFHYQYGAILQDRYYPCIEITSTLLGDLTGKSDYDITKFLMQLNLIYTNSETGTDQRIKQYIAINSKMKIAFLRNINSNTDNYNKVVPVLMITDAATMDREQLDLLRKTAYLTYIIPNKETGKIDEAVNPDDNKPIKFTIGENGWLFAPPNLSLTDEDLKDYYKWMRENYEIVYPRFKINSLFVKSPYTMITVKRQENENWEVLANYENFYILPRTDYYTVTIKPEAIFLSTNPLDFPLNYKIYFTISLSPLVIYLDAVQVLKENAFPKVSYEIDVMSVNKDFIYDDYTRLGQIGHINDYEFRFENTMGYISELNLNLDKPWEDRIIIKNYKTKFEDIFSTIVAQTEQMKKNSATITMTANAFNSDGTLSSSVLGESLMSEILTRAADNTVDNSVPSPATEYLKYDPLIRNELRQVYNEAGEVLAAASKSVEDVAALNLENGDILASFQTNVAENMTPTQFIDVEQGDIYLRQKENSTDTSNNFKVGDIWKRHDGNTYMATQNSHQVEYSAEEDTDIKRRQSLKGWSLTQDGSLAQIKGAALDINTKEGTIDLRAQNSVNIAGGEVQIVGNNKVSIGGPDIYIYSANTGEVANLSKGIHIYSSVLGASSGISAVDITGNGIKMLSGKSIDFISSDNTNTTVMSLSKDKGIYLGSSQPIIFYSGTSVPTSGTTNASAKISNSEILFGVSDGTTGTAVRLNKNYIIFGAGNTVNGNNYTNIGESGTSGLAGIKISKDAVKIAVGDNSRSYLSLTGTEVKIAQTDSSSNGAQVIINKSGVHIGTSSKSQTFIDNIKNNTYSTDTNTAKFEVYAPNFVVDAYGYLYAYGANIGGTIRATSGQIGGWTIGNNYITTNTNRTTYDSSVSGMTLSAGGIGARYSSTQYFTLSNTGILTAYNATISGKITATEGTIGGISLNSSYGLYTNNKTSSTSTNGGFLISKDGNIYLGAYNSQQASCPFQVTSAGYLTARNGKIGGWTIDNDSIFTGTKDSSFSIRLSSSNFSRTINGNNLTNLRLAMGNKFGVTEDGKLYASDVDIEGTIHATDGEISGNLVSGGTISGVSLDIGEGNFIVNSDGYLSAKEADIEGGNIRGALLTLGGGLTDTEGKIEIWNGIMSTDLIATLDKDGLIFYNSGEKSMFLDNSGLYYKLADKTIRIKIDSQNILSLKDPYGMEFIVNSKGSFSLDNIGYGYLTAKERLTITSNYIDTAGKLIVDEMAVKEGNSYYDGRTVTYHKVPYNFSLKIEKDSQGKISWSYSYDTVDLTFKEGILI